MPISQIKKLIADISNLCTSKGWRESLPAISRSNQEPFSQYAFPAYIALAHSELTEALEAYRDKVWSSVKEPCEHYRKFKQCAHNHKPIGVGPELGDVIIRILDMCDIWNIDIEYEIQRVIEYGWTRPYQHGGKTL